MRSFSETKYPLALIAILFLSFITPCHANEPPLSLLKELSQASTPKNKPSNSAPSLVSPADMDDDPTPTASSEFFTLEEFKNKSYENAELDLSDIDLPLSDIPLTLNNKVAYFLSYFQTRGKPSFSRWLSRSSRYIPMMKEILKERGMPEDLVYLAMIESGFHVHAKSWANAVGPWQFISETGRRYSLRIDHWIDERKDPVKATTAAALYLKELHGMFNGDWYLAAAGYNAGENKILRAIDMYNTNDFWELSQGSYLKRETKEYVPKLLAAAIIAKEPERYGFSDVAYLPPIEFDTVTIPSRTDLDLIARLSDSTFETIRELNPDLRHWCTPPNYPDFELKIPKGTKEKFEEEYAKIPEDQRFTEKQLFTRYRARKGDSLKSIARRFGSTTAELSQLNNLSAKTRIAGRTLVVPAKQTVDFSHEGRLQLRSTKIAGKTSYEKYHIVKKGDTVESIAKKFKVSTKLLVTWNNLKNKLTLQPGRRIIVARFVEKNGEMVPVDGKS